MPLVCRVDQAVSALAVECIVQARHLTLLVETETDGFLNDVAYRKRSHAGKCNDGQEPFGLDFTCVDVALTDNGPYVFEVSAFGGFRGLKQARGLDVAELFTAHVLKELAR